MFCSRFCAVTMISVKTGGFAACCCAQLEPVTMALDIANTRATPCRKGTRRIVIAPPYPVPYAISRGVILCHPLWTDRHSISVSSLREGLRSHLASGVNLLTLGAIPDDEPARAIHAALLVVFLLRGGAARDLQVGASWSEL